MIVGAFLLLIAALGLIVAELYLPSHGILACCAGLFAIAAVVMAYIASPIVGMLCALAVIIVTPVVFVWAVKIYPRTPMGRKMVLQQPALPVDPARERMALLIGRQGTTMTMLRPAGAIDIDGQRIDCMSEAEVIPAGTPVEVIRITGGRVIVKSLV